MISTRGTQARDSQAEGNAVWATISNLYHPDTNPNGFISLGVAENSLCHEELQSYLSNNISIPTYKAFTYGDGPNGSRELRQVMAKFLTTHFNPVKTVLPEHIMVTAGVSAAIEHVSWALADPGEGILLGRPYYRAFLPDISLRPGVRVVSVTFGTTDPCGIECVGKYEEALTAAQEQGIKIRALMLCHPHNPLGRCYSRDTIIVLMRLCQMHEIHLVSDEIYALSTWENTVDTTVPFIPFESALSINTSSIIDPALVHVLWGMSKDFGANGIRLGAIISQSNPSFLNACRTCGLYSSPSSLAELATAKILADTAFVENYIALSRTRLSEAYAFCIDLIREQRIDYAPGGNAAFFVWMNLGKAYRERHPEVLFEKKEEITKVVWRKMMEKRVFIVHGDDTGAEEEGWFRLVFTQDRTSIREAMRRIVEAIN